MNNATNLKKKRWYTLLFLTINCLNIPSLSAQPSDLPWNVDPVCNSIITTGIAAITCGTTTSVDYENQREFFRFQNFAPSLILIGKS